MKLVKKIVAVAAAALVTTVGFAPTVDANLVNNGSFEQTMNPFPAGSKGYFNTMASYWGNSNSLTFLDSPGTADNGSYLSVYGPFPTTSPDGGNFVEANGDPQFSSVITQTINNLTPGAKYKVSFYQAAGQQVGFTGTTTEYFAVTFGSQTINSTQSILSTGGVSPWQAQSMLFTATSSSQVLSFLSVGGPAGAPPIGFLDGVSVDPSVGTAVPLPKAASVGCVAMLGLAAYQARKRKVVAQ